MLAILNSLNAHNFPIFQLILMILVSKFMVHRALSDKTYLSLGLLSPLSCIMKVIYHITLFLKCLYTFVRNCFFSRATMSEARMFL